MTLIEYKDLLETRLDIRGALKIVDNKIIPSETLTKKVIKEKMIDDLFSYHFGKLYFTNRFLKVADELTNRSAYNGHYSLELKEV